jgi:hypothetical protein
MLKQSFGRSIIAAARSITRRTGVCFCPINAVAGDQRSEPVREVDHLRSADAREEVLVATRESDHLVRKGRPANNDLIVIEDQLVELDADRPCNSPSEIRTISSSEI